ncbi:Uncharacterised protein [Mycobacteroides abscessus subsp. abscessus]|uniref:hypothetical protein n=1 Tax=Mycobacteroides abscessus TaxID=36809 RepID=UPI00092977B9|nr:hypothetical protein [Mycobacteroides abscessus]MEC4836136.1 hypothetical protein [Mycobacteroides chelonae]MDQ8120526.1 hypothetical protein [Mycobacteroides abscessus subsp. massiliense]PVB03110.1 hypothetical protein DDJ51_12815 [Mycobacteroides abscessus]SID31274.1 Uncharacterised protein [Mycobacteroides abscessus subsp. abscessus]SID69262.1 Uncharacterised protein [Mycobacteroides abscessus subsp. abscessus]
MAVRIKYNMAGFRKIRHAYGEYVEQIARQAAEGLPDGYVIVVQRDPNTQRPRIFIVAASYAARRDDAANSRLLKLIAGLRGR